MVTLGLRCDSLDITLNTYIVCIIYAYIIGNTNIYTICIYISIYNKCRHKYVCHICINANANALSKLKDRFMEWIVKHDSTIYYLQETHFKFSNIGRLEVKA